ncbi:MAG TPA: prephenate dehydrogenase/arogenate dehydrogenase family protein [Chloroflexota bacterium]|nr:prephenate dehydrogenase/arogenate dehydrogenase family protein [Chloroflexota bacterium]
MRIAILGVGLIGGSIGLAVRREGWQVTGWGPRDESLQLAARRGAVDRIATNAVEACEGAELIVLAGPIRSLPDLMRAAARGARAGTVVTDVASVKGQVMRWAEELLPPNLCFVGGHPMAGKEVQGVGAADPDLLRGATYCLVPGPQPGMDRVEQLVSAVGARKLLVNPEDHDRAVAAASHLPFMVATALVEAVGDDLLDLAGAVAAGGFSDTSRVAQASPAMHADICNYNAPAVADMIARFEMALAGLKAKLAEPDIEADFTHAAQARQRWSQTRVSTSAEAKRVPELHAVPNASG